MTAGQSLVGSCFMCTCGTGERVKFQRSVSSGSRGLSTWDSPRLVPGPVPFSLFLPQWPSWCCLWSIYLFYANRTDNYLNTQFQIIWSCNVAGRAAKKSPTDFALEDLGWSIYLLGLWSWINCFTFLSQRISVIKLGWHCESMIVATTILGARCVLEFRLVQILHCMCCIQCR